MEIQIELRYSDRDIDLDEPTDPVRFQFWAPKVRPPGARTMEQKWVASGASSEFPLSRHLDSQDYKQNKLRYP
jgi:hypothetical protein